MKTFRQNFTPSKHAWCLFTTLLSVALSSSVMPPAIAQDSVPLSLDNCVTSPVQLPYPYIAAAEEVLAAGIIDDELVSALEGTEVDYEIAGPSPRALPAVAAMAAAAVAWCTKGALSSLVPSTLQQLAHQAHSGIEPPTWVMNAIFGCAGGPILGALTSQAMRVKFAGIVLATVIKVRNFG